MEDYNPNKARAEEAQLAAQHAADAVQATFEPFAVVFDVSGAANGQGPATAPKVEGAPVF